MFKKFATKLALIALSLGTLFVTQPASATPQQNFVFPAGEMISVQKTLKDNRVFAWGFAETANPDTRDLVGYLLASDGTQLSRTVFETFNRKDYLDTWTTALLERKNGSLVLGWSTFSATSRTSYLKMSSSSNGLAWSTPVKPLADFVPAVGKCLLTTGEDPGWAPRCGYMVPTIAEDGKGRIGVLFTTITSENYDAVTPVSLVTSTDLKKWTKPVSFKSTAASGLNTYPAGLIGVTGGGFAISVNSWGQGAGSFATALWKPGATNFSSISRSSTEDYEGGFSDVAKLDSNRQIQFVFTGQGEVGVVGYRIFNQKTKSWGSTKHLTHLFRGCFNGGAISSPDLFGDVYFTFQTCGWDANDSSSASQKLVLIRIPAGGLPVEPVAIGSATEFESPVAISFDSANNPVIFEIAQSVLQSRTVVAGVPQAPNVLNENLMGQSLMALDRVGNLSGLLYNREARFEWIHLTPSNAPSATALPTLSGKAKSKSSVTVSNITFRANTDATANSYQWYTCDSAVSKALFNSIPNDCSPIPGATTRTYRTSTGDIGQYLAVTVSSSNGGGTTQILTKSTGKVSK